jgi:alpha-1,6-mannosyltransferase
MRGLNLRTITTRLEVLHASRWVGPLLALAYLALALIHWRHSWWALSHGQAFADLGDSRASSPVTEIFQTLTLLCLFGLYLFCLVRWDRRGFSAREVMVMSIAPSILAWGALPANSTDIMFYIGLGRIAAIYGANPYIHTYSEFDDFYSSFVQWDITMPYGPVVLPFFILAGWVSRLNVLASIFFLKFIWLMTHCCNCWLIYRILKTRKSDPAYALFLYGLNPLIMLELVANGHNDGLLICFGLLSLFALQRQKHAAAVWLALLSALVKLPGVFFLLAIVAYLVWRREWRGLGRGMLVSAALLIVLKVSLFPSFESLKSIANTESYTKNSLHDLLIGWADWLGQLLGSPMDYETIYSIDRRVSSVLFLSFCLWRLWRISNPDSLVRELAYLFLALLIGYAGWFFPWYVAWLIPLAALTESSKLRWAIIIFSWTALALYAFPNFIVEQAPLHWLWAMLRIAIVHLIPLILLARADWSERGLVRIQNPRRGKI